MSEQISSDTIVVERNGGIPKERFKYFLQPALGPWLFWVAVDWFCIVAVLVIAAHLKHPLMYIFAAAVIGNRQHALEILGHDAAHYAACKNRKVNDWLAILFCYAPMWVPLAGYRKFHFAHHHFLGTEKDTELPFKKRDGRQWALPMPAWRIFVMNIADLLGYGLVALLRLSEHVKPVSVKDFLPGLVVNILGTAALWATGNLWVLFPWYGGMITFYWVFSRWRMWFEHQGTGDSHRYRMSRWLRILVSPHNTNHHWEHHKWLSVPFSKLPQLRKEIVGGPEIKSIPELLELFKSSPAIAPGEALRKLY